MSGLVRQYLPKVTDLLLHSQEYLDAIARNLNTRPRTVVSIHNAGRGLFDSKSCVG